MRSILINRLSIEIDNDWDFACSFFDDDERYDMTQEEVEDEAKNRLRTLDLAELKQAMKDQYPTSEDIYIHFGHKTGQLYASILGY